MSLELKKDENGNVVTNPVTGWTMISVEDMSLLLAIQYVETPQELETGSTHQIQLLLMPQECLKLAEALTRNAKRLLEDQSGKPPH